MPYARTRLGRLFYEERSDARRDGAPCIVLLHGLLFDSGMWEGQLAPLAQLGRVVAIDGPGHGKSERPPRFSLEEHADALVDAFDEIGVARALLVGLSWGGMVALRFALQHAPRVAGLALLDTSASAEPLLDRARYRTYIALHRRVGTPPWLFDREIAPLMFAPRTLATRPELARAAYQRANGFDRDGAARAALAVIVHRSSVKDKLGQIRAPSLVLCGREDTSTPPDEAEALAHGIPGARLVFLDGVGHMSALEDPEAVNAHLVPFARDVVTRAG